MTSRERTLPRTPPDPGARPGFTFIELVASLAIIMLVSGILFPVFAQARESARRTHCQSNLQQVMPALHLYAQDYDGRFPPTDNDFTAVAGQYTKNTGVYGCPSEPLSTRRKFGTAQPASTPSPGSFVYSSYQYRGGYANDDPADLPVVRDWEPWHRGRVNVLYLGGQVRSMSPKQVPTLTASPRPRPR